MAQLAGGKTHVVTAYDPKSVRTAHLPAELQHSANIHPANLLVKSLSTIAHAAPCSVLIVDTQGAD